MEYSIFADESGTDHTSYCYTIGALGIPNDQVESFNLKFEELKEKHGVIGEVKWAKINKSHGPINFGIDLFKYIANSKFKFAFIVTSKNVYRKWSNNKEDAFYATYTFLLKDCLKTSTFKHSVFIDNRQDSYDKNDEVVEIITNNMLNQIKADSSITSVTKSDSKEYYPIQAIDLFTGAINFSHNLFLKKDFKMNKGKQLLISKIAELLGWDNLHYDTMPDSFINIWHFPKEYRANPRTMKIMPKKGVDYILPENLLN